MKPLLDLLKGWSFPPIPVASARAFVGGVAIAILTELGNGIARGEWGQWQILIPPILFALVRVIEGIGDNAIDPQQNATAERRASSPPQ